MSGARFVLPDQFAVDPTGVPYAGGQLFFFQTGTNTPQNTYSDPGFTVPNTNPIILDSAGRAGSVFMLPSPNYRVVLQDASGGSVFDMDPVGPGAGGGAVTAQVPVGGIQIYAGLTLPGGWLWCDGSAISRTVYATLFTTIGTSFGAGDGATTFNIPDLRGRAPFGQDNMNGVAANRITTGGSGINGIQMGAAGGDEHVQLHTHPFSFTDPGHDHALTDPGHRHPQYYTGSFPGHGFPEGGVSNAVGPGAQSPDMFTANATTGITIAPTTTGISASIGNFGTGVGQNMPPCQILGYIIFAA